jgi:RNA polymerase primary sigma factor
MQWVFHRGKQLEQEDEIRIAKEIEAGVFEIMQAITLYPVITEKFFKAHKRLIVL